MSPMGRLAWFTPLPPTRSGIAAYNAELLPWLTAAHRVDVFTAPFAGSPAEEGRPQSLPGLDNVHSAHDFVWRHERSAYDLVVYQLGNASCHDFMWPYLPRYPGLVVLHDGQLHHERSRALLSRGRAEDYRAEFRYNHPDAPQHLPDLVISTLGGSLYYLYPMLRWVLKTARLVAVHGRGLASRLSEDYPGVAIQPLRFGTPDPAGERAAAAGAAVRQRHGIPERAVLFAAFGLVTPEKRVSAALRGLAGLAPHRDDVHLLLAGGTTAYYDAAAEAAALGVSDRVHVSGYVPDEELDAYLMAADVALCLRWPTSGETSAMWMRAIAAGKPTVVTDLAHSGDVPALDPGTWQPLPTTDPSGAGDARPVAVAIDILNEDAALRAAMTRLADDEELRRRLGAAARDHWKRHNTMSCGVEDYLKAIERAMRRPAPRVRDLPRHLVDDHTGLARQLLGEMGVDGGWLGPGADRKPGA